MSSGTVAEQLAGFCASLEFDRLPIEVRERTKELLLDYLGVCYGGMQAESSQSARLAMRALGGPGLATVIGQSEGAAAAWAALVNGCSAHALEMDDVTTKSSLHPGVAVFPAVLALAEELQLPSKEAMAAVVAGYEVTMRVGSALNPASAYRRGFHPTGVAGAFGAAAACARLLDLDPSRFVNALGVAGTMAAGSLEYLTDGAWTKRLNAGWAAHCGVVAARLAEQGFSGPSTTVEGSLGLLRGHSDEPYLAEATAGLGEGFQIMRVSIKPYACCRYSHGLIDCALRLRREPEFALEDVEEIRLGVLSGGALLVADPIDQKRHPKNVVDAQFSAPFAAAIALVNGSAGFSDYVQANVDDLRVRRLMERTTCYTDPKLDAGYPERWPSAASIRLRSGRVIEAYQPYALGEPENPVDRTGLTEKFRELVDRPFADEVADAIWALPNGSIGDLLGLLRPRTAVSPGGR